MPTKTSPQRAELLLRQRRCRLTAREIATKLHMPRSTVAAAVLKRHGPGRLRDFEPAQPEVRYEQDAPGDLVHLDVKKLAGSEAWVIA